MTRPSNLIYGVSEKPPAVVCLSNAAQLLTVVAPIIDLHDPGDARGRRERQCGRAKW